MSISHPLNSCLTDPTRCFNCLVQIIPSIHTYHTVIFYNVRTIVLVLCVKVESTRAIHVSELTIAPTRARKLVLGSDFHTHTNVYACFYFMPLL